MPDDASHPFRGVRYSTLVNEWGPAGALIQQPGRIFELRFVALTTASGAVRLYDHTRYPQNPIGLMNAGGGLPDVLPSPGRGITVPLANGLYVSFSMGTGVNSVAVGWDS